TIGGAESDVDGAVPIMWWPLPVRHAPPARRRLTAGAVASAAPRAGCGQVQLPSSVPHLDYYTKLASMSRVRTRRGTAGNRVRSCDRRRWRLADGAGQCHRSSDARCSLPDHVAVAVQVLPENDVVACTRQRRAQRRPARRAPRLGRERNRPPHGQATRWSSTALALSVVQHPGMNVANERGVAAINDPKVTSGRSGVEYRNLWSPSPA